MNSRVVRALRPVCFSMRAVSSWGVTPGAGRAIKKESWVLSRPTKPTASL
jgi:hypothetical protein